MSDEEVLRRTLAIQPKLTAWLKSEMPDLSFQDAMQVLTLLFESGLEAARRQRGN